MRPGSSPLARGLRRGRRARRHRRRIIPARAGFTWERVLYSVAADGSSPLARGLPDAARNILDRIRIIPARAGFTAMTLLGIMNVKDHPRSRGVYSVLPRSSSSAHGSSPLARGLLEEEVYDGEAIGIIPARAGFTSMRSNRTITPGDHPRSRGVYPLFFLRRICVQGSSPLARGLHADEPMNVWHSGIIPARAGFTSRTMEAIWSLHGSSPLARGLLLGVAPALCGGGIIPARAGFTPKGICI